jgi:hypothetical protein
MNYQETGNKVPIASQELTNYVYKKLATYGEQIKTTKIMPSRNPYTQSIIYKTEDGKTIKIPKDIQKQAISNWIAKMGDNVPSLPTYKTEMNPETPNISNTLSNMGNKDWITLAILIFAAVLAIYLFYKIGENKCETVPMTQTRYFLTK